MYDKLAEHYDKLMDFDYDSYVERLLKRVKLKGKKVLELGCGTGSITERILPWVDSLVALDPSETMLSLASAKLRSPKLQFLQGSTLDIPLSQKFDVILACVDVINYIAREELVQHFVNIRGHLEEGGVFFFDLSREEKLRDILGDNVYFYEEDEVDLVWINQWQEEMRGVAMQLIFYERGLDDQYIKSDEEQFQYAYNEQEILEALHDSGLQLIDSQWSETRAYFLTTR